MQKIMVYHYPLLLITVSLYIYIYCKSQDGAPGSSTMSPATLRFCREQRASNARARTWAKGAGAVIFGVGNADETCKITILNM